MRKVVHDDDSDFEDSKVEESKNKEIKENKNELPLEDLQRNEDQHDDFSKTWKVVWDYTLEQVIGDPIEGVKTWGLHLTNGA